MTLEVLHAAGSETPSAAALAETTCSTSQCFVSMFRLRVAKKGS